MRALLVECLGVRARLEAAGVEAEEALGRIAEDFQHFVTSSIEGEGRPPGKDQRGIALCISIRSDADVSVREWKGPRVFRTGMCRVYGFGLRGRRICDYGDGMILRARNGRRLREFELIGRVADSLHEVCYTTLLSALGEELDRRGIHRIHAAGLRACGVSALIVSDSGAGKSSLSAELLKNTDAALYSDESPLIEKEGMRAFPVRMALRPEHAESYAGAGSGRRFPRKLYPAKVLHAIPGERVALPGRVEAIFLGRGMAPRAVIREAGRLRVLGTLLRGMVVGVGLTQMAEHMLRADAVPRLFKIGYFRFRAATRLAWTVRGYVFEMSPDAAENRAVLLRFLSRNSPGQVAKQAE